MYKLYAGKTLVANGLSFDKSIKLMNEYFQMFGESLKIQLEEK